MTASTAPSDLPKAKMSVPLLDLQAQYRGLREEMRAAIDRVMESQHFIMGSEVQELEKELAEYCRVRHAIGCANGSDALLLALMALGVGPGDEVITTPYSFFATASAITRLGATPVFVDIEPHFYNIDVEKIEAAITSRTRAIMPVHLYGQCAQMNSINEIATRHGIPVVEDAAQAIGADEGAARAGGLGAIGCFSFYPSKNLGAAGDAGMITTNDDSLADKLRILRVHGGEQRYYHRVIGINSRLDALQAAILRVKLPHLDNWSDGRAQKAARYDELFRDAGLSEEITTPVIRPGNRHIFHQYIIRTDRRDQLFTHLKENNVGTDVYYPVPLHLQECFGYLGYAAGAMPVAEQAAKETLALPVYPELSDEQQKYVVDVIREFFA
jgi:dTDP-4-amino-4,6-dideoxygalactose transaminase